MVAPRKIPPGSGWRKFIHRASFQTLNLGESPAERHYRELQARIRRHIRKQYVIGVVSGKGGVGKTTMTACVGAVFRECRPENVVAIDAAPGFGTLAGRIDESPPGDYAAVLNDTDVQGYADIREHLGQNSIGLDVLAGNRASDQPRPLVPSMFTGVLSRLRRTHTVIVVDTSDDLEHPVMKAVLDACDTLVFVSGLTADASLPVTRAIDLLRSMGYHELVSRSMVILNDSRNKYDRDALNVPHRAVRAVRGDGRIHAVRSVSREGRHNRHPARVEEKDPTAAIRNHRGVGRQIYSRCRQAALMAPVAG